MKEKVTFNFSRLEGLIKQHYDTQEKFAEAIPMARSTLNQKLNNHIVFDSNDIYHIIKALDIKMEDVGEIFFSTENSENRIE